MLVALGCGLVRTTLIAFGDVFLADNIMDGAGAVGFGNVGICWAEGGMDDEARLKHVDGSGLCVVLDGVPVGALVGGGKVANGDGLMGAKAVGEHGGVAAAHYSFAESVEAVLGVDAVGIADGVGVVGKVDFGIEDTPDHFLAISTVSTGCTGNREERDLGGERLAMQCKSWWTFMEATKSPSGSCTPWSSLPKCSMYSRGTRTFDGASKSAQFFSISGDG
jgi:hypothetical protein